MREIVVVSGKGGTGKTSILASFAALAQNAVIADCDVDAPNLHLVLQPKPIETHTFLSGHVAQIDPSHCRECGACMRLCRFGAIHKAVTGRTETLYHIDQTACEGCGVCVQFCPTHAIAFSKRCSGTWSVSQTKYGPMVHARLFPGAENSGKLVSTVRKAARDLAQQGAHETILVDGPPGIGCPVIASIGGADEILVASEPSPSGLADLTRVLALARHFKIRARVCINKWDINPKMADKIEHETKTAGADVIGRVRYDPAIVTAQRAGIPSVEIDSAAASDIRVIWKKLTNTQGDVP